MFLLFHTEWQYPLFLSAVNPEIVVGELGNASITKIVYDGKTFTVESVNDMSYVKDTE